MKEMRNGWSDSTHKQETKKKEKKLLLENESYLGGYKSLIYSRKKGCRGSVSTGETFN